MDKQLVSYRPIVNTRFWKEKKKSPLSLILFFGKPGALSPTAWLTIETRAIDYFTSY